MSVPDGEASAAPDPRQYLDEADFVREKLHGGTGSAAQRYARMVLAQPSLWRLIEYELLTTLVGPVPGALGLVLRQRMYPRLFKRVGRGVIFGRNILIRHGGNITLGDGVVVDDNCLLDGRGAGEQGIAIGDDVMIHRGATVQAKAGAIEIGRGSSIGAGSVIVAQGGIEIGEHVSVAGGCYISGGSFEHASDGDGPEATVRYTKGPIRIESHCRLGMAAVVLDGVHLASGCVVGAGSVVMTDMPGDAVAMGVPARNFGSRLSNR